MILHSGTTYTSTIINTPHGFGTKQSGDGRVLSTIETIVGDHSVVIPHQRHSAHVAVITKNDIAEKKIIRVPNCDALVTDQSGVALTVVTADCVPIIYDDPRARIIGISHQGWKGTLANVPQNVIERMKELGSNVKDIRISMGPAINNCCYPMIGEREALFIEKFGGFTSLYHSNRLNILDAGIDPTHIDLFPFCTSCDSSQFYSYKRDLAILGEQISYIIQ